MNLTELYLTAFGKFKNKSLEFDEGINLIYGENEAGKSTIHKFIEGMFYGFFKPFTRTKRYREAYGKYLPWYEGQFQGTLKYEQDDVIYRIERNFLKGQDDVKIYDERTGEDLTHLFEYDKVTRLHQPASNHLGVNAMVYQNTISIKQMGSATDKQLAKEVKDSLMNLGGSLDDEISVKNVLSKLDKKMGAIGTKGRVKTSPYGQAMEDLTALERERSQARHILEETKGYQNDLNRLISEVEALEIKRKEIERSIWLVEGHVLNKRYIEARDLKRDIGLLQEELKGVEGAKGIDPQDYDKVIALENRMSNLKENLTGVEKRYRDLRRNLDDLEIAMEGKALYGQEQKIKELRNRKNKLKAQMKKYKTYLFTSIGSFMIGLALGIGIMPILSLIALGALCGLSYTGIRLKRLKKRMTEVMIELDRLQKDVSQQQEKSKNLQSIIKSRMAEEQEEIKKLRTGVDDQRKGLMSLLVQNGVGSIEAFRKAVKNKRIYERIEQDLTYKKELLERVLGDRTLETLEVLNKEYEGIDFNAQETYNKDSLQMKLQQVTDDMIVKGKQISALEEKIQTLSKQSRAVADIEEDIFSKEKVVQAYEHDLKALELTRKTIEEISKAIQKDFAPRLNQRVGQIIENLTDGKYKDIKVSENLQIKVTDPEGGQLIELDNLSGGTIDQLYFATRLSIIEIIKGRRELPLLLDDCFVQYDENRLQNMLGFLAKEAERRQIFIFTCHAREKELLDAMGIGYNYIEL